MYTLTIPSKYSAWDQQSMAMKMFQNDQDAQLEQAEEENAYMDRIHSKPKQERNLKMSKKRRI